MAPPPDPRPKGPRQTRPPGGSDTSAFGGSSGGGVARTILLIESDPALRDFWVQVFREEGFQALLAEDEAQACRQVHAGDLDLVFLGSNMDGARGLELMQSLKSESFARAQDKLRDLLVVAPLNTSALREEILKARDRVGSHPRIQVERLTLAVKKALNLRDWKALPFGDLSITQMERQMVEAALKRAEGNQTQAARLLGISRFALRNRLKKYSLPASGYKEQAGLTPHVGNGNLKGGYERREGVLR